MKISVPNQNINMELRNFENLDEVDTYHNQISSPFQNKLSLNLNSRNMNGSNATLDQHEDEQE